MEQKVTIKNIGWEVGTVGWLAKGLKDGSITLNEGSLKSNGNHGLWLKWDEKKGSQFLAAYNVYGLSKAEWAEADEYRVADRHEDRDGIWTDAAWSTLMDIARQWCDTMNAIRENDEEIKISIIRTAE